ncbi:MAG: hypothetical protein WC341_02620 [Bacteroidales bacterium]
MSSLICLLALCVNLWGQSPHGDELKISCDDCHKTKGWTVDLKTIDFHHDSTGFALVGQHQSVDCKSCHTTLVFSAASSECVSCHTDMHNQTVSMDCNQCHTPQSWLVSNITEIHQMSRFPLLGAHATADCYACHPSASTLDFQPQGIECIDCHLVDFQATTDPGHVEGNFSTNCVECHNMNVFSWTGAGVDHSFFPLNQGHALNDCYQCHVQGDPYNSISPECITCHQSDFLATTNPNHAAIDLSTNCLDCHTTLPGWSPAKFTIHDARYFPIYSGEHNGEWDNCMDCHTNASNYAQFTCTGCHEHNKADTDDEHDGVGGYIYDDQACFDCHPTGSGEGGFNHNLSNFPLTGAHLTTDCIECHANGYAGTSMVCVDCHQIDFNQSTNPNHVALGLLTECQTCHSTNPGWVPATFDVHNDYYLLQGAHTSIANDCSACHQGNYNNTPNSCVGCHQTDYNQTTNPAHAAAQFPTECETCHTQSAWAPSTFNHDGQYFPIYSGKHNGEWNLCSDCHTNPTNYAVFSCIDCHEHNKPDTDDEHDGVSGYQYNSNACFDCHPDGSDRQQHINQHNNY